MIRKRSRLMRLVLMPVYLYRLRVIGVPWRSAWLLWCSVFRA